MDWWKPAELVKNIIKPEPKKPRTYRVGISPGHGGLDSGAISVVGDYEANLARQVAKRLESRFRMNPSFNPAVYGYDEKIKNYTQRVKDSNSNNDDFYIPIHFNAGGSLKTNGWMILMDPEDVKKQPLLYGLASSILLELQTLVNLGFADFDTKHDGIMLGEGRPIYELTKPKAKTVYLELGFLSNMEWALRLKDEIFLMKIADAIEQGFEKYLSKVELV